jgi:hypothetical protein
MRSAVGIPVVHGGEDVTKTDFSVSVFDGECEVVAIRLIATALQKASEIERRSSYGMYISLTGTLTHAARSLRELAAPPDTTNEDLLEQHEDRLYESQPSMRAQGLDDLAKHLGMLKTAIETGDSLTVRKFFEIYRFD